ncbi:hypothetical protein FRC12_019806 [Ceratobasidium sp. 428]|nr:hypothetical protein FRC12_019806 [Ceratobasidium sp. 428]
MHGILNDSSDFEVCLFQDPWWGKIGVERSTSFPPPEILGTVSHRSWDCFVPPSNSPDVAVYIKKGLPWLSAALSTVVPSNPSVLALDVSIHGFQVCLVCVYHRPGSPAGPLRALLDFPVHPSPIIYAGDFNLHHELWSLPNLLHIPHHALASDLAEWILSNNITVANTPSIPTRLGHGGQQDSPIASPTGSATPP